MYINRNFETANIEIEFQPGQTLNSHHITAIVASLTPFVIECDRRILEIFIIIYKKNKMHLERLSWNTYRFVRCQRQLNHIDLDIQHNSWIDCTNPNRKWLFSLPNIYCRLFPIHKPVRCDLLRRLKCEPIDILEIEFIMFCFNSVLCQNAGRIDSCIWIEECDTVRIVPRVLTDF